MEAKARRFQKIKSSLQYEIRRTCKCSWFRAKSRRWIIENPQREWSHSGRKNLSEKCRPKKNKRI